MNPMDDISMHPLLLYPRQQSVDWLLPRNVNDESRQQPLLQTLDDFTPQEFRSDDLISFTDLPPRPVPVQPSHPHKWHHQQLQLLFQDRQKPDDLPEDPCSLGFDLKPEPHVQSHPHHSQPHHSHLSHTAHPHPSHSIHQPQHQPQHLTHPQLYQSHIHQPVTAPMPTLSLLATTVDLSKPINALGPLCFSGFYLVSLTRTIVRNRTVPKNVRRAFMAAQLHHRFTVRDKRDHKWRNIPTVQIPYDALSAAGDWLRRRLAVTDEAYTFKHIKDALQKAVTEAWGDGTWDNLVRILHANFPNVRQQDLDDVLGSESISGRAKGTPLQFFRQINCHKGATDIGKDVDGAINARQSLRWVLTHLGFNLSGCNISITKFRDEVFPLWKHQCAYVQEHNVPNCCQFYDGGYFKKIMIHKHLYNVNGCSSSYHVKDLFEGLDEVIKVRNNPTGMCVREAKCAAGLRYNVDKSFQSGIRSYSKSKFLEAAPHTANEFLALERQLHDRVHKLLRMKQKRYLKCRKALRELEVKAECLVQRQLPDILRPSISDAVVTPTSPTSPTLRKRKRHERDSLLSPSTPREQKRKHAHLSLKRKEAAGQKVRQHLEELREDCQIRQSLLDSIKKHGEECSCQEILPGEVAVGRYATSNNVPVA